MKKITLIVLCCFAIEANAQNVGIGNTNPQAKLDISGDVRLRSVLITLPAGLNNNVDINTVKSSVYMFAGGALSGCQITGFTAGVDGRFVTIFNNSTTAAIQLYDESNATNPSAAANKILTGTGNSAIVYQNGSVTLRYDGTKQRWTVVSSNFTDGLGLISTGANQWTTSGSNIFNNNNGNVGIGLYGSSLNNQLQIGNPLNFSGNQLAIGNGHYGMAFTQTDDASIMYSSNSFALMPTGDGNGNVGIGTVAPAAKLSVIKGTNNLSPEGSLAIYGTTYSSHFHYSTTEDTYIRGGKAGSKVYINDANIGDVIIAANGGNVGIGTSTPTYKLSVNGNIRSKEVVVESNWADYVFEDDYKLPSLESVELHIKQNKHLPGIPSADNIQKEGLSLGVVQTKMMQKIEELTLYVIELKKEIELLKAKK